MNNFPIIIIGAGPAGLMAAQQLAEAGKEVIIYEQGKAAARKFLVAGHGGFNLTHTEPIDHFILKYDKAEIGKIIQHFDNKQVIAWLKDLGIETFVGSSGKIFPIKGIKPIQVLNAWLEKIKHLGVKICYEHRLIDFDQQKVIIEHRRKTQEQYFSKLILALGGGSWQKTGSDAKWVPLLASKNIAIHPLASANSGYNTTIDFSEIEGEILKNIEVEFDGIRKKGEMVFTSYGIEGSPIYYLNRYTRPHSFPLTIYLDLKPTFSQEAIARLLTSSDKISEALRDKIHLSKPAFKLLKKLSKTVYTDPLKLAKAIKLFPIEVGSLRPIDEVISTAGGIKLEELDHRLALKNYPHIHCIGEMLDWEAPTGGYLLQACFSMGHWTAQKIINI